MRINSYTHTHTHTHTYTQYTEIYNSFPCDPEWGQNINHIVKSFLLFLFNRAFLFSFPLLNHHIDVKTLAKNTAIVFIVKAETELGETDVFLLWERANDKFTH